MQLNNATVRQLQKEMTAACKAIAEKHGLICEGAGGSIGFGEATLRFKVTSTAAQTQKMKVAGIEPGHTFQFRGKQYRVIDYVPSRPQYPIIAERLPDGKKFKFKEQMLAPEFRREAAQP